MMHICLCREFHDSNPKIPFIHPIVNHSLLAEMIYLQIGLIEKEHSLQQPNVTSVSHSFPPMHSELRRIIHEYSGHFGIETVSHGQEPRRNVVAIAKR